MSCTLRSSCWTVTAQYSTGLISTEHRYVLIDDYFSSPRQKQANMTFAIWFSSLCCPRVSGFSQVRNTRKHTVTAINGSRYSLVYIFSGICSIRNCKAPLLGPPAFPTVRYSPQFAFLFVNVKWIMQPIVSFAYLFNMWVNFYCLLLSLCSDISKKKKRKDVFSM